MPPAVRPPPTSCPAMLARGFRLSGATSEATPPPKPAPAPIAACCPAARAVFCGPAPKTFATCAGRKPARAAPKGASIAPALPHLFGNALSSAFCGRQSSGANAKLAQQSIDRLRTADRVFDIRYLGTMPDGLAGCIDRTRAEIKRISCQIDRHAECLGDQSGIRPGESARSQRGPFRRLDARCHLL